jgi:hypothetical protein
MISRLARQIPSISSNLRSFQLNQGDSKHKLLYFKILLEQYKKVDVAYYTPTVRTTLNLCVYLCALPTLALLSISEPEDFQTSLLQISKRVLQTVPVSNHNKNILL